MIEVRGEDLALSCFAVCADAAQHDDAAVVFIASAAGVSQEDVAVRRRAHEARHHEVAGRVLGHLEACGSLWPRTFGARHELRSIRYRAFGHRLGQVCQGQVATNAGLLFAVVGEGRLTGKNRSGLRVRGRGKRRKAECEGDRVGSHGLLDAATWLKVLRS
ncbi:hypothetical protein ACFQBQ_05960 [Granulicella cerasi]|uniref:Uncharacterized protein n=1 Tax=Granulicella cerasi TaxID=741063 RepID=A0ABW1Z7R6_9BACT